MCSCASGVACPRKVSQFKATCPQRAPESGTAYRIEINGAGLFSRPRVETRLKPGAKSFCPFGAQTGPRVRPAVQVRVNIRETVQILSPERGELTQGFNLVLTLG
jgi:hypothetical protein